MMPKLNKLKNACVLLAFIAVSAVAGESAIPLQKGSRIASDDLIYNNQLLSSREADRLQKDQNVDLSLLSPKANDMWGDSPTVLNDQRAIAIDDNDVMTFEGSLLSNSGLYRFNAIPVNGNKFYTIHLDKTLHTMLLRKNLLRALGYKIPAMKYLKKIVIKFPSKLVLEKFLKDDIPKATLGAAERWAKSDLVSMEQLTVTLQDVAITGLSEEDFYNVSMGIPTVATTNRTMRALVLPYALADLYESVNKFNWIAGKVDNKSAILSHFTGNEFSTTVDDAQWMLKRLNKLTRQDFQKIVEGALLPTEVSAIIVEKIIARRNSLNRVFETKVADISFNAKLTLGAGEVVKDGKIMQKDYPEYASRFAYGDAESPLEQLNYFLYSKVQSNIIDNLVNKLNTEMVAFQVGDARVKYFNDQFQKGLNHFVETGELLPIKVGAWFSPVASPQIILSRDIVLGNYLGTDNMVQLADTFGVGVDVGLFVGIEGLGNGIGASVKAATSVVRTYTHIKPVKNLKESLKEKYKNMFVNLLKSSLKDQFYSLSELKELGPTSSMNPEDAKLAREKQTKMIEEVFTEINKNLGVGESLLITDRLMPSLAVKVNFTSGLLGAGAGANGGVTVLKRIHIYKKSAKLLQIYDDAGFVKNIDLNFEISNYISILRGTAKFDKGHYNVKSYMVNLSTNLAENPDFFSNAMGVYNVLKNRDFEILESTNPPVKLDAQFTDNSKSLSLLFWKMKSLNGKTYYDVKAKDGVEGKYFSLEKDFLTGLNPEAFSKQLLNYYLTTKEDGKDIRITEQAGANPGESFLGSSQTKKFRFEAVVEENKSFGQKFLALSDVKQGWAMSEKKIVKFMTDVNKKFQHNLFDPTQIDFTKLRLYNVGYHMNLYNRGLEKLHAVTVEDMEALEKKYKYQRICDPEDQNNLHRARCGNLYELKTRITKCPQSKNDEEMANCSVALFEQMMDELDFSDFKKLIGEDNFYVYGSIDGFREKSEILNDTIYSNSIGKIGNKQWNGPLDVVRELLGLSNGEFSGSWAREGL